MCQCNGAAFTGPRHLLLHRKHLSTSFDDKSAALSNSGL
jgi:hypothetical protein